MHPRIVLMGLVLGTASLISAAAPIALHPDNPHYFLWRGQPRILITSGEHYGALLNLDFDFRKYLDTLARDGLNNTRIFSGAYVETQGDFKISRNTLDPAPNRFICPWARSEQPGYSDGGNKFDLTKFDPAYFRRLRELVSYAGERGVVVEMNLFCPFYGDSQWKVSPMNPANNINGVGDTARTNVYTLDKHGGLLPVQEAMVREIVQALRDADNVYYEICNEPYFGGVTMAWQHRMVEVITEAQREHPFQKLISINVANKSAKVVDPHPGISIFNFHYATPPIAVGLNYHLNKPIGDNETGFRGTNDAPYRSEAWEFILAGGSLFNHLDYSFAVGHEDGSFAYPASQPGGGNPGLRRQFGVLAKFMNGFDFVRMKPDPNVIRDGVPEGDSAWALSEPGRAYAIYLRRKNPGAAAEGRLQLELPPGTYVANWTDPCTGGGRGTKRNFGHGGGISVLDVPAYGEEIALSLRVE